MRKKKVGVSFFGFLTLFVLVFLGHSAHASETGGIPIGTVIPEFKLQAANSADQDYLGLKGPDPFTMSQVTGKLVIFDFISVL